LIAAPSTSTSAAPRPPPPSQDGVAKHDLLVLAGTAALGLGGTLQVSLVNSFLPDNADVFTVVSGAAALTGAFANVVPGGRVATAGGEGTFMLVQSGNNLQLADFQTGAGSAYDTWAGPGGFGLTGANAAFDFDSDGDGLANGLEWLLGGDPTHPDAGLAPAPQTDAGDLVLEFQREDATVAETTLTLEWAASPAGPWSAAAITETTDGVFGLPDGITLTLATNGAAPDTLTLRLPGTLGPAMLFARLRLSRP
jgi:hypothetical protein